MALVGSAKASLPNKPAMRRIISQLKRISDENEEQGRVVFDRLDRSEVDVANVTLISGTARSPSLSPNFGSDTCRYGYAWVPIGDNIDEFNQKVLHFTPPFQTLFDPR